LAIKGEDMILATQLLAAASVFLIVVGLTRMLWLPAIQGMKDFNRVIGYQDPISASIIAFAGGQEETDEEEDYQFGITSEVHTFLRLSKEQYKRGVFNLCIFIGILGFIVFLALFGVSLVKSVLLGVFIGVFSALIINFTNEDRIKQQMTAQVRQFPFFLDIFLLTVQSNGNIQDAIKSYSEIFGHNEISQELMILREDLKSHSMVDSFDRLRNRVGNEGLRNILGELTQKLRTGTELQKTLEQQSEDMRTLREELGAQAAERLNAKFAIPVVLSAVAVLLIFLAPAIVQMSDSGFL
jgi:pilus assembly protein TadC